MYEGWDPRRPGWICPKCGFDYDATPPAGAVGLLASLLPGYQRHLLSASADLRARSEPDVWSALEYACHVRDCLALYEWRIGKALAEDHPVFPQMRRDAVVIERAYNEQDPTLVLEEMTVNYERLADLLGQVKGDQWARTGIREGEELSVAWMAVNTIHEARHHLMDIDNVVVRLAEQAEGGG